MRASGDGSHAVIAAAQRRVPDLLEFLRRLVEAESPTGDEAGNRRVADLLEEALARRGFLVHRHPAPGFGDHLVAHRSAGDAGGEGSSPLMILGHMDTVHPTGTLKEMPFSVSDGRITGPGVFDMKGSWACLAAALDLAEERGWLPSAPLVVVITCDEEVGSPTSRELVERTARSARACLVLEPSLPGGGVKLRRKGTGEAILTVRGRAAHAGVEPEAGASAIHEMARQILAVLELADPAQETHVNVGLVRGGTGTNVVSAVAEARVDLRFWTRAEGERLEAGLRALTPHDSRCSLEVRGGINRHALEPTPESLTLYERAREAAANLGFELGSGATGGGSDGNLTAAVGCPTLDGLGPDGGGAHTLQEHILSGPLPGRVALLSRLLVAR